MKEAHKLAKGIKAEFPEVDYKFQLGLCITYLANEGANTMVALKGSEKQVKWAEQIKAEMLQGFKIIEAIKTVWAESMNEPVLIAILEDAENAKTKVENEDRSEWFIDNKYRLIHYSSSDYKEEIVRINLGSFIKSPILEDVCTEDVKKVYCDMFYTAR